MNSNQRKLFAVAVLTSAVVSAGCSTDMFTQANNALKTIQTAGKAVGNARLPTAAIAASLGGMKMMEALSADGKEAKSSGIIAAGGGNIIAAGGLNYDLLALEPGKDQKKPVKGDKIDGTVEYSSSAVNGNWVSEIKNFECTSQGYKITAKGQFTYMPEGNKVTCTMTGEVSHKDTKITLTDLNFNTEDPLPANAANIGGFTLTTTDADKVEYKFVASIGVKDSKIVAEADSYKNGTKLGDKVKFDETNAAAQDGADIANRADDVNKAK